MKVRVNHASRQLLRIALVILIETATTADDAGRAFGRLVPIEYESIMTTKLGALA